MQTEQITKPEREKQRPATGRRVTALAVTGMTCSNCARHVTEAIQSLPGVDSVSVDLEAQRATVRWEPDAEQDIQALIKAVEDGGYGAKPAARAAHDHGEGRLSAWRLNLLLGVPVTAFLMIGEWAFGLSRTPWFRWGSFGLATLVQVFAGARFYRGAWNQLRTGSANMDMLVALGSTTAFGYSAWALLSGLGGHVYFMEAAAIITLISTGHWLESRVSVRASSALRRLLDLTPALACRHEADGKEAKVPVADLVTGDIVVLRPGDSVPTDGEVVEGDSVADESMLTGEATPMDKSAGSQLFAGTLNLNGRLVMRVTATGEETALAHVIAAVQRAQMSRANIQRLGDRVSSVFVPLVVVAAVAAGLWWGLAPESAAGVHAWFGRFLWSAQAPEGQAAAAFIIAAAVLIIACPCAMGLATPVAIMAGSNAAAERGILVRDGVALEKAGEVTAVLFDKTGTLTQGKPSVVKVWEREIRGPTSEVRSPESGVRRPESEDQSQASGGRSQGLERLKLESREGGTVGITVVQLAACLARHSTHPVSQAIAKLSSVELALGDWQEISGAGVQAKVSYAAAAASHFAVHTLETAMARLGSVRWLRASGVDVARGDAFIQEWSEQGATLVGVAVDSSLYGLFAVKDTLKSGARAVVARLQREGLTTWLVTGDNKLTAASIAGQAGIQRENVFAEVRPERKAEFVTKLQQQGERVAFVGDGINDAPALEQADLGIAVSRASDIAREAADIILLNSEIEAVPESLGLARATLRTIKQNLFWAFFYNTLGVPLAALGYMSPILCAAAMGLSDLVVIGNALRLRRWRRAA